MITHDIPIKIVRSKWLYFSYLSPVVKRASAEKINDAAPPSSILYTDSSLNSPQAFVMPKQQQKLKSFLLLPMLDMCGKWIGQTSTTKRSHPYNTNVTLRKRGERRRTDWKEAKIKLCHLGINMSVVVCIVCMRKLFVILIFNKNILLLAIGIIQKIHIKKLAKNALIFRTSSGRRMRSTSVISSKS